MEKPLIDLTLLNVEELDLYNNLCPNEEAEFSEFMSEVKQLHLDSGLSPDSSIELDSSLTDWYDYFMAGTDPDEAFNNYYFED